MMFQLPDPKSITEREREEASQAYILTLMTVMVGLPFPIINLFACVLYYLLVRSKSPFVRFHAFQAMSSQLFIILMNTVAVSWSLKIIFRGETVTDIYVGYVIAAIIFNLADYVVNIIAAIKARKGQSFVFAFFGTWSYLLFMKKKTEAYGAETLS